MSSVRETVIERLLVKILGNNKSLIDSLNQSEDRVHSFASGIQKKITGLTSNIGGYMRNLGMQISGVGAALTLGITAPLVLVGRQATMASVEFEAALSRMEGLVGVSKKEVAEFKKEILDLSSVTGKGPIELAKAMEFITGSGMKGAVALETLNISAKAGAAGLGEVVDVANAVTSAINAYGPEMLSATKATDILVATVREGKAEASSFAPVFGQVLPLAKEMGVSFGEVGGILAFLTRTTGNAAIATTQLRSVMSQLNNQEFETRMKKNGLSVEKVQKNIQKGGLAFALRELKKDGESVGVPLRKLITDIEGMMGALQLTGSGANIAAEMIEKVNNAAGDTDKAFTTAANTAKHQWNVAMAEMQKLMIGIGDILGPTALQLVNFAQIGIGMWKNLDGETQKLIVNIALVAAAIGPVLAYVGLFVGSLGTLITAIGGVSSAIVALAAGTATIGVTVAAAAGVIGAVMLPLIYEYTKATLALNAALAKSNELNNQLVAKQGERQSKKLESVMGIGNDKDRQEAARHAANIAGKEIGGMESELSSIGIAKNKALKEGDKSLQSELDQQEKEVKARLDQMKDYRTKLDDIATGKVGGAKANPADADLKKIGADAETAVGKVLSKQSEHAIDSSLEALKKKAELLKASGGAEVSQAMKEVYDIKQAGGSPEQVAAAEAHAKNIDAMEVENKLREKAKRLQEDVLTPQQKFLKQQEELQTMLGKNMITQEQFDLGLKDAQKTLDSGLTDKEVKVTVTTSGIDAAIRGSADAANRIGNYFALRGVQSRRSSSSTGSGVPGNLPPGYTKEMQERYPVDLPGSKVPSTNTGVTSTMGKMEAADWVEIGKNIARLVSLNERIADKDSVELATGGIS